MLSVVLRVGRGQPPRNRGRGGRGGTSPARPGARTSCGSGRYVWLVASRLFYPHGRPGPVRQASSSCTCDQVHRPRPERRGQRDHFIVLVVDRDHDRPRDRPGRPDVRPGRAQAGASRSSCVARVRRRLASRPLAPNVPLALRRRAGLRRVGGHVPAVDWALMTDIIPKASARAGTWASATSPRARRACSRSRSPVLSSTSSTASPAGHGPRVAIIVGARYYAVAALLLYPVDRAATSARTIHCRPSPRSRSCRRPPPADRRPSQVVGGSGWLGRRASRPRKARRRRRTDAGWHAQAAAGSVAQRARTRATDAFAEAAIPGQRDGRRNQAGRAGATTTARPPRGGEVVEPDGAGTEAEQRLQLDDRQRQGGQAQQDGDRQPDEPPRAGLGARMIQ